MNLYNEKQLNAWLNKITNNGGGIYLIDFYDYYKKIFCDHNGIPNTLIDSIKLLKQTPPEEIDLYQNCSEEEFNELKNKSKFIKINFAVHSFWSLEITGIKFLPTVIWSEKLQVFRLEKGYARCLSKYLNNNSMNVIWVKYPGHPVIDADLLEIASINELYDRIVYPGFSPRREIYTSKIHSDFYDKSVHENDLLVYGDNEGLDRTSELDWKKQAKTFRSYALTLDERCLNLDDFKRSNYKSSLSKKKGGILKLRNN